MKVFTFFLQESCYSNFDGNSTLLTENIMYNVYGKKKYRG